MHDRPARTLRGLRRAAAAAAWLAVLWCVGVAAGATDHWAFTPVRRPSTPAVRDASWPRNPIDHFVLAELEQRGITPSTPADPATLLRRVAFDLTGMPPASRDVEQFAARPDAAAYAAVVERLLDDVRFGETWARHWLDQARYADSAGHEEDAKRDIWRYRDWVVNALNRDMPFDQFLIEQLAGDLIPNATVEQKIATGFQCNAPARPFAEYERTIDRVDTYGTTILGLTLGCARCHDHKFDPISQREYFQLYAYFDQARDVRLDLSPPAQVSERDALERQIAILKEDLQDYQNGPDKDPEVWAARLTISERRETLEELFEAIKRVSRDRTPEQVEIIRRAHADAVAAFEDDLERRIEEWAKNLPDDAKPRLRRELEAYLAEPRGQRGSKPSSYVMNAFWKQDRGLRDREKIIAELAARIPATESTLVMRQNRQAPETRVFETGDPRSLGERVEPGVPAVLTASATYQLQNRLDLAKWTASRENPLTARVAVNRIWQAYFGVGLVETSDNFGTQTPRPEYADLLDWLAAEFMEHGWSQKHIHRLILGSATYQQSSHMRPDLRDVDPQNRLFARQSRLRLPAEGIRDAALAASGLLNPTVGGPSVFPYQPDGVMEGRADRAQWTMSPKADRYRRTLYTHFWRLTPHPFLVLFDAPDAAAACTRRARSNTPLQALTLLNDPSFAEAAVHLAQRIIGETTSASDDARITWAMQTCLSRPPDDEELQALTDLLQQQRSVLADDRERAKKIAGSEADDLQTVELAAWTSVSRVLLNLDEFITRE